MPVAGRSLPEEPELVEVEAVAEGVVVVPALAVVEVPLVVGVAALEVEGADDVLGAGAELGAELGEEEEEEEDEEDEEDWLWPEPARGSTYC